MIVMKFGGSSLADAPRLLQVADLVLAAERTPCVVLSAPGDSTDRLLAVARAAAAGRADEARDGLAELFTRWTAEAEQLGVDPERVPARLRRLRDDVELLLLAAGRDPAATARVTDAIVAHGERISTSLLCDVLQRRGARVVEVDARDVVRTDRRFGRARPDRAAIRATARQSILPHLATGTVVVTQGFVGSAPDGATTTLGRGGSDWSASLLGAALGVEEVQIWTDVEGVLTADPRVVPEARPLVALRPEEAAELAAFGARVLHPATIQPAVDAGIPVTVRHTGRARGSFTRIAADVPRAGSGIAAIASRGPVSVLTMTSRRMLEASGYLAKLFDVFGQLGVAVDLISTAEVSVACTVEADAPIDALREALAELAHVEVTTDQSIVALVGEGLRGTEQVLERACRSLGALLPRMVCFGGNSRNLSFVVARGEEVEVVRRLHDEFLGGDRRWDAELVGTAASLHQEVSR